AATLKQVRDFPAEPKLGGWFEFAPDGKTVVIPYRTGDNPLAWTAGLIEYDLESGREVRRCSVPNIVPGAHPALGRLVFAPDGNRLFISSGNAVPSGPNSFQCVGYLRVWDRATGKVSQLPPHNPNDYFGALTFSPDGKRVYVGSGGYVERTDGRARWRASRV